MKKFQTKLKYDFAEALLQIIDNVLLETKIESDDDRLFLAGIVEVKTRLYNKLAVHRPAYVITLSPVQALSLRLLYIYLAGIALNQYMANRLRQIADEVHKHYS